MEASFLRRQRADCPAEPVTAVATEYLPHFRYPWQPNQVGANYQTFCLNELRPPYICKSAGMQYDRPEDIDTNLI